jgi:hypothetical protein
MLHPYLARLPLVFVIRPRTTGLPTWHFWVGWCRWLRLDGTCGSMSDLHEDLYRFARMRNTLLPVEAVCCNFSRVWGLQVSCDGVRVLWWGLVCDGTRWDIFCRGPSLSLIYTTRELSLYKSSSLYILPISFFIAACSPAYPEFDHFFSRVNT